MVESLFAALIVIALVFIFVYKNSCELVDSLNQKIREIQETKDIETDKLTKEIESCRQIISNLNYEIQHRQNTAELLRREYQEKIKLASKEAAKEAVNTSRSILKGKISEQMAPLFNEFKYKSSDSRFIGSPVDYVIFNGMSDGSVTDIVLVDIKTPNSGMTGLQRQIRNVIKAGKVDFAVLKIETPTEENENADTKT